MAAVHFPESGWYFVSSASTEPLLPLVQTCRNCEHVVHNLGPLCFCGCTDGYPDMPDAPPLVTTQE